MACALPSTGAPLAPSLADYLDCHAATLGHDGAQALAGSIVPALLTSCLVIYVALIGYRLLLGQAFGVKDMALSIARIALVIAFCTRWPSYEAVIYRVVTEGPSEVAATILRPSGISVVTLSDTAVRIQMAYDAIKAQGAPSSARAKALEPDPRSLASLSPSTTAALSPQQGALGGAGLLFMLPSLGGLLAVRFAGALLLAIGPLIIALALFDSLLGLFEGWIRALVGVSLATVGLMVVLALKLVFIEAELAGASVDGPQSFTAEGLMMVAALFGLVQLGMLITAGLIARGFKLPRWRLNLPPALATIAYPPQSQASAAQGPAAPEGLAPLSRAQAVADAVTLQGQRERGLLVVSSGVATSKPNRSGAPSTGNGGSEGRGTPSALGSSLRRSPASRRSPSVMRRNGIR